MILSTQERLARVVCGVLAILVLLALYAPVLVSALFSLVPLERGVPQWHRLEFGSYVRLWQDQSVVQALLTTGKVAALAVLLALVLAVLLALYTEWRGALAPRALEIAIYLPFLLPPIVTGLSLLVTAEALGVERGLMTIVLGHIALVLAVSYRLIVTRMRALPPSLLEASADLGASPWQSFRLVLLPHLSSALISGGLLSLTLSFDETLITFLVAGDQSTLPTRLWAMMRLGFKPEINALVTLVLVVSILLTLLVVWRMRSVLQSGEEG